MALTHPESICAPHAADALDTADPGSRNARTLALYNHIATADAPTRSSLYDEIVLAHINVAESVARRYRNRGIPHDDLVQVACLGLVKAAHRFDPTRSDDFLSYAVPTMLGEVKRFFRDHAWAVRPPRRIQELQAETTAATAQWQQRTGASPTPEEVAAELGARVDDVREAMQADNCYTPTSLDRPATEDASSLGDLIPTDESGYATAETISALRPLCAKLSARDRRIIYLRFFREWTQARIAEELHVTQMQVSRLLRRILRDLREQISVDDQVLAPPA